MRFLEQVCSHNSHEWSFLPNNFFRLCLSHQNIWTYHKEIITNKMASSVIFLPTSREIVKNTFFLLYLFPSFLILSFPTTTCPPSLIALGSEKLYGVHFQNCLRILDVSTFECPIWENLKGPNFQKHWKSSFKYVSSWKHYPRLLTACCP